MSVDEHYYETKNQVIKAERRMLKELGFCIHFKHPHKVRSLLYFILYLKRMIFIVNVAFFLIMRIITSRLTQLFDLLLCS